MVNPPMPDLLREALIELMHAAVTSRLPQLRHDSHGSIAVRYASPTTGSGGRTAAA
ncbi:hypothetical protein [Microbispora sp. H11081]|uniref:hypothetical protein n=1 Tax=Microbispora sp. H11081 TaxID=2729107 RepID=UPI001473922D|nr:hypothetical protein [Microbispora sp. H11081]